ncbi:DUF3575 domain-containing protein [Croceiramulus getboli]|nr:DUF3575 domain-containing protein [Flavobacteriaceae bacterium YJPT1-3]
MRTLSVFTLVVIGCVFLGRAQNTSKHKNQPSFKNEFRLNAGSLVVGFPEVSYERLLNEDSALGISFGFTIDDDIDLLWMATPFYRFYFGEKPAAGFFLEGNSSLYQVEGNGMNDDYSGFGVGLGGGGKFLTRSGWIGEILLGIGRNFINTDDISEYYPRVGISIGRRF